MNLINQNIANGFLKFKKVNFDLKDKNRNGYYTIINYEEIHKVLNKDNMVGHI